MVGTRLKTTAFLFREGNILACNDRMLCNYGDGPEFYVMPIGAVVLW